MLFSPVNPSDLHMVRGRYGYQPVLPASPGAEGVGRVLEIGAGVTAVHVGERVICIGTWNLWRERVICKASNVVPVPGTVTDETAATSYQNPLTAWALTQSTRQLGEGQWLLQTAAASSVGRLVLQLAGMYGFRTINVIHRRAQAAIIQALEAMRSSARRTKTCGGRLQEITGGKGIDYAIDCVAGEVGGGDRTESRPCRHAGAIRRVVEPPPDGSREISHACLQSQAHLFGSHRARLVDPAVARNSAHGKGKERPERSLEHDR